MKWVKSPAAFDRGTRAQAVQALLDKRAAWAARGGSEAVDVSGSATSAVDFSSILGQLSSTQDTE